MGNYRNTLVTTVLMHRSLPWGAQKMLESAAYHGIEVSPFGQGMHWEGFYKSKIVRFFDWARKFHEFDYILFTDGDDVLYAAGLGELHQKFETYGAGFVMSGEHYCWPYSKLNDRIPNAEHRFRHPCSGFYMATWPAFISVFERIISSPKHDPELCGRKIFHCDQAKFQYAYGTGQIGLQVDFHCRLCQSLNGLDGRWTSASNDIEWSKRPLNKLTGSYPCVFHANGSSKWRLPKLWDLLRA